MGLDDVLGTYRVRVHARALGKPHIFVEKEDGKLVLRRGFEIKPGTQPGDIMTLKGKGVTHLRGTGRGDILVHAGVQTPTKLTPEQEELLRQLAALRGEERPVGRLSPASQGLFGKLRDAFLGK